MPGVASLKGSPPPSRGRAWTAPCECRHWWVAMKMSFLVRPGDFPHGGGGSFSSAEGPLPSFERAVNLLSRGKAFLDVKLPTKQALFVINLNGSRASSQMLPLGSRGASVGPGPRLGTSPLPSSSSCRPRSVQGSSFCLQVPVSIVLLSALHPCGCWCHRRELARKDPPGENPGGISSSTVSEPV